MIKRIQDIFQRKQLRKSITSYEELVESNPNDTRMRLKLGDLYIRAGLISEAVDQYIASAERLANAGFQLKSIALYKQILKLDPESIQAHRRLAQLAFQHGLLADSFECYTNLAKCLRKRRAGQEQVEIFEGIFQLDLKNLDIRLILAEVIFAEDSKNQDVYKLVCSRLRDISSDPSRVGDVKSIAQWLFDHYPKRWEAFDLFAFILHKQGDRDTLGLVADKLETLLKEAGIYDDKMDLLIKYRGKTVAPNVPQEDLTKTSLSEKTPIQDQVKIKLETNIYDILKKKAEEDETFEEEKGPKAAQALGFADLFQNFKNDLQAKVAKGDYETHYNLGIAYREMSLHEDAIEEFKIALEDPKLRYDCYFFMGQSLMELDQAEAAITAYEKGLSIDGLATEKLLGLTYELALALLKTGRKQDALRYFKQIHQLRADYRDVVDHINTLQDSTAT